MSLIWSQDRESILLSAAQRLFRREQNCFEFSGNSSSSPTAKREMFDEGPGLSLGG